MESMIRNVKEIEAAERKVYEDVLGEHLQDSQRVLIMVLNPGVELDEAIRSKAIEDFHKLCKQGTENRERLGVSVEEADQIVDEAIQHTRSQKSK